MGPNEEKRPPHVTFEATWGDIVDGNLIGINFLGHHIMISSELISTPIRIKTVAMAAAGESYVAIAERLDRSPETVKSNIQEGYTDLGAVNVRHAARRLFETEVAAVLPTGLPPARVFTRRERQVVHGASYGLSYDEIAAKFKISPKAVQLRLDHASQGLGMTAMGTECLVMLGFCTRELLPSIVNPSPPTTER